MVGDQTTLTGDTRGATVPQVMLGLFLLFLFVAMLLWPTEMTRLSMELQTWGVSGSAPEVNSGDFSVLVTRLSGGVALFFYLSALGLAAVDP